MIVNSTFAWMLQNSTLQFDYPTWYIGFCVLAGLVYAVALYFRDKAFKDVTKAQRRLLIPMSIFRLIAVSTIAFLLLAPLLKTRFIETVKPYIIFAQDNSESVANAFGAGDSAKYVGQIGEMINKLSEQYNVQTYSFGEKVEEGITNTFDDKITNISESLDALYNKYDNQNVGAIILATDGIYNQGSNPIYKSSNLEVPVYAIALGDTTPQRDLLIDKVLHNRIAYLGDKFTIRADVSAKNCKGEKTVLNVYKGKGTSNKVYSKPITINNTNFVYSEDIILDADKPGIQQYSIRVTKLNGEVTTLNNQQNIFVDVLDSRQKILILAASPHPDIAALKKSIENNKNYEATVGYAASFNRSIKDYNLAILHGLPATSNSMETLIGQLKKEGIAIWYIVTEQTAISTVNRMQDIVQVKGNNTKTDEAKANVQSTFNLFTFEPTLAQKLEKLPPLVVPFGGASAAPTAQTLMTQQIGTVSTDFPLLTLQQSAGGKTAVMSGEGLWRWRLYDYKEDGAHETVNELISKVVQYLAVKTDKRKFRANVSKTMFNENESITFDAELYNDSYELINTPDVSLNVYNTDGKEFPFVFSKSGNAYALNAGFFPVGNYSFKATTNYNGKTYTSSGSFSVAPIELENLQTTANHQLINSLTQKYGGAVFAPDSVATLLATIEANKPPDIQYETFKTQSIINLKWLFYLILSLLTLEWFIRKYLGGY